MIINRFYKVIICLLIICFTCVLVGSINIIRSQTIGTTNNPNQSLLVGIAFCLLCFIIIWKSFRWLNTLNEKSCYLFSLIIMLLMTGVMTAISFSARVTQFVDSIDVMDTAFYLRKHAEATEELPYIRYVGSFGNNYPVILFESFLIRVLTWMGFQDVENVLNHMNVFVLMTAVVLTWLIVEETRGTRAAAKTAVVCLLNPYFYLLLNWTYSMSYSLPLMMGSLYIALRLKKVKTTYCGVVLAFTEGVLIGSGFLIRPTAVFPLIAAGIVWFPSFFKNIRKNINSKRVVQFLCVLVAIVFVVTFVNVRIDRKFGKIKHLNMPLSFWLLLGSHGDGAWNDADLDTVMSVQKTDDRAKYALDKARGNYAALGLDGVLSLWCSKVITAWADGGFFYWSPAISEANILSEYIRGSGARNQLTKVYSQAFRLLMILGFLLACMAALAKKSMPEIDLVMTITVFGCVVFHIIWETNVRYSIPFILPMLVIICYGISTIQEYADKKKLWQKVPKQATECILVGFLIIVFLNLNVALREENTLHFNRVFSSGNTRMCAEIPQNFQQLNQDFYAEKSFNSLFIKASLPQNKKKDECSEYEVSILNDDEQVLNKTYISPEKIGKTGVEISFEPISGYNHYLIRLKKTDLEKESIVFYTQDTFGVNPYRGKLTVDGEKEYPSDLMMDVYESKETSIFSDKARIAVNVLVIALCVFAFIPARRKGTVSCAL